MLSQPTTILMFAAFTSPFLAVGTAHVQRRPRTSHVKVYACAERNEQTPPIPMLPPMSPYPLEEQKFGFAALIGPSNSGKSTLLNYLMGQKVAIVTPKVQTTRCRIAGITSYDATQVVYLDTPGIFSAKSRLDRAMVKSAWSSGRDGDTMTVIVDAAEMYHSGRRSGKPLFVSDGVKEVVQGVVKREKPFVSICANKMDAVPEGAHEQLLQRIEGEMMRLGMKETQVMPISARYGNGIGTLVNWVTNNMPNGPWMYPEDDLTDMPARLLAAEVIREQAFLSLRQELPYEIAVETTSYKNKEDGSVRITSDVLVARESQKRIVTGRGGEVVKKIGMMARKELGEILGTEVHLMLRVKVKGKWKEEKRMYDAWGLDYNA